MDDKSLEMLEFPKVLVRLAALAGFSASKELARALKPCTELEQARLVVAETSEARQLLELHPSLTIGGVHDVRPHAEASARGKVLEPSELLDLLNTLTTARTTARSFEKLRGQFPVLERIAAGIEVPSGLIESISSTINERGELLDSASEKLRTIRGQLREAHGKLNTKLQRMVGDQSVATMLQEPIITQRDGRYVVPLKAEFKGRLKSIVHDQSSSGATLFVEPLAVVSLNNQLRESELAERDEIRRILAELSTKIGGHARAIRHSVEALARLDLAYAKGRYADLLAMSEPQLRPFKARARSKHPGSSLVLMQARHPLLDPGQVVPIDLELDSETYALVITGPNTGGKTIALKTAGLLALMAQSGLHIPAAPGSSLSVFDAILVDIGDEQSIEQSLSTFSAHIGTIIKILEKAGSRSLVLVDELGAGTDPQEGASLARAILHDLVERGATTIVATHYPELKTFAHLTPGVQNASVEFDLESLRPTYHLTMGIPGRSNALAIAERLGLNPAVVSQARAGLAPEGREADYLLEDIRRQRQAAQEAGKQAQGAWQEVDQLRASLADRLAAIEQERRSLLEEAHEQARAELTSLRLEIGELRQKLLAAGAPLEELRNLRKHLEALEDQVDDLPVAGEDLRLPEEPPLRLGDRVTLTTLGTEGVLTEINPEHAEVQVGRLRVRARLEELSPTRGQPSQVHPPQTSPRRRQGTSAAQAIDAREMPIELDLRGEMVEEAIERLGQRLDSAYLAGMPFIRVIHGKGTGRLRQAIRQSLGGNPYVASFRPGEKGEGGEGATVIFLAND